MASQISKDQLLDEVYELIREKGYHAVTPSSLGEKLGESPEDIQQIMDSFENLDEAILKKMLQRFVDFSKNLNPVTQAPHLGASLCFLARDQPNLFRAFDQLRFNPESLLTVFEEMGKMIEAHPYYSELEPDEKRELRSVRFMAAMGLGKFLLGDVRSRRSDEDIVQEITGLSDLLKAGIIARRDQD